MRLGPVGTPQILSVGQSSYLRKAGKDLFDIGFLLASNPDVGAVKRLAGIPVWKTVRNELAVLPTAVREMAADLARRVAKTSPLALIPLLPGAHD